jgi:hypothetical protein
VTGPSAVGLHRTPTDTSRPATLWTARCAAPGCGWNFQWGSRGRVKTEAEQHPADCAGVIAGDATLSDCGAYRYELTRTWNTDLEVVAFLMLNPSTADARTDDATIRRCVGYARSWRFGGLVVRNLYALRATDPRELHRHPDPIGPDNDTYLDRCAGDALTVLAWGAHGADRGPEVITRLQATSARLAYLRLTRDGHPHHPLRLPTSLIPIHLIP